MVTLVCHVVLHLFHMQVAFFLIFDHYIPIMSGKDSFCHCPPIIIDSANSISVSFFGLNHCMSDLSGKFTFWSCGLTITTLIMKIANWIFLDFWSLYIIDQFWVANLHFSHVLLIISDPPNGKLVSSWSWMVRRSLETRSLFLLVHPWHPLYLWPARRALH